MNRVAVACPFALLLLVAAQSQDQRVRQFAPGVYFWQGDTAIRRPANCSWVLFKDYVVVIDANFPWGAREILPEIRKTTNLPIRFVFNTHYHADHAFGSTIFMDAGATIVCSRECAAESRDKGESDWKSQVLTRADRPNASTHDKAVATETREKGYGLEHPTLLFDGRMAFDDGERRLELIRMGPAHSIGDAVAYLPKEKILMTGDLCVNWTSGNNVGDRDADHDNWIRSLDALMQWDVRTVVPGHGQLGSVETLKGQRAYLAEMVDRVRSGIRALKTADQDVVTAKIAAGDKLLTLVDGLSLLGPNQLDGLVDGGHPNDLGFQWMAEGLAPHIAKVLQLPPPVLTNDRRIHVTSAEAAESKRAGIIRYIWGAGGFPRNQHPVATQRNAPSPITGLQHVKSVETMTIRMEAGQENTTHHFLPKRANGKLAVLQHGHGCTFDDLNAEKSYGLAHTVDQMLGEGYGVLIAYMPHMRPDDCGTLPHGKMFDLPVGAGNQLKFFLEPVAISLNALKPRYKEIHMAGLSGGGWTTTLYAAIDPSIRSSYPVAGSIPLYLRIGGSVGDLEQYLDAFYQLAGYPDLYVLGSIGPGRKQVQILNRRDDCCFGEAQHDARRTGSSYEDAYRAYERRVQKALGKQGEFRLVIDETAPRHMISPEAVRIMLREMKSAK